MHLLSFIKFTTLISFLILIYSFSINKYTMQEDIVNNKLHRTSSKAEYYKIEDKYKFTVTKLWGGGVPIYFPLQCEP